MDRENNIKEAVLSEKRYDSVIFGDSDFGIAVRPDSETENIRQNYAGKTFHEEIEIKYFFEGVSTLVIGSDVIVAEPGDITVANPYEIHATIESENGKYHLLDVDLDFVNSLSGNGLDLRSMLIGKQINFNHHIKNNKRLQTVLLLVVEEFQQKKEYYRQIVQGLMMEFFSLLLREETNQVASERDDINTYNIGLIVPAFCKIHVDYDKKITIDELAAICNINKYHFCRVFRKATGMTAMQYLLAYRIKIADIMLKNSDRKISEISKLCGFDDECYFCRCYKKIRGISPRKNRDEMLKK